MADDEKSLTVPTNETTPATVRLEAARAAMKKAFEDCQSAILFCTHPDLTALDTELHNLYPDERN